MVVVLVALSFIVSNDFTGNAVAGLSTVVNTPSNNARININTLTTGVGNQEFITITFTAVWRTGVRYYNISTKLIGSNPQGRGIDNIVPLGGPIGQENIPWRLSIANFTNPQPGETFSITVQLMDSNKNPIANQIITPSTNGFK